MTDLPADPQDLARYVVSRSWAPRLFAILDDNAYIALLAAPEQLADVIAYGGWAVDGALLALAEELAGGAAWVEGRAGEDLPHRWEGVAVVYDETRQETRTIAPTRAAALITLCDALWEAQR